MKTPLPRSFADLVEEICHFTRGDRDEVERRVWMEALNEGSNITAEAFQFGVVPHIYNENMAALYREGFGFIYETLVFWTKAVRQKWAEHLLARISSKAGKLGSAPRILIMGDGTGSDSIFLATHGFKVYSFDIPGSRTFDFAIERFKNYDLLDNGITVLTDYKACLANQWDIIVSLEVLEHLLDPVSAIRDIGSMLSPGGIALISEGFSQVTINKPTHLRSNQRYHGRTPFLFWRNDMELSWYSRDPLFKPFEFTKVGNPSLLPIVRDRVIVQAWLSACVSKAKAMVRYRLDKSDGKRPTQRGIEAG